MTQTKLAFNQINGNVVSVLDFGADPTGAADSTAAIQAAIDTGGAIVFPEGTYKATGLTQSANDQKFIGLGNAVVTRGSGSLLLTSTGRNVSFDNISFLGNAAGTGNLVKCTGDIVSLDNCSARTDAGHAVILEGNSCQIQGTNDIYYSAGTGSSADAAIAIGVTGTSTLYTSISAVKTSTSTYGIKYYDHGASAISDSQLGTVDMTAGAAYINNCRIVGDYIVTNAFNQIKNSTISGDVTLGDGSSTPSGISFGPGIGMQSGATITINKMRESHVDCVNLGNGGITITDNLTGNAADIGNNIFFPPLAWAPTWRAVSADPSIGNGTISGFYTRQGSRINVTIYILMGSTTTYGTGSYYFPLPAPTKSGFSGGVFCEDSGTGYLYGQALGGFDFGDNIRLIRYSDGFQFAPTIPITWANGDEINIDVTYTVDNT